MPALNAFNTQTFRIGFDPRDTDRVLGYWGEIIASQRWTEGPFTQRFEERWSLHRWLRAALPYAASKVCG